MRVDNITSTSFTKLITSFPIFSSSGVRRSIPGSSSPITALKMLLRVSLESSNYSVAFSTVIAGVSLRGL